MLLKKPTRIEIMIAAKELKKRLILVVSDRMDQNKKPGRKESDLIRMSSKARDNMGFTGAVEVTGKSSVSLSVFHAYTGDLRDVRSSGKYTPEELKRLGFVTQRTFDIITGNTTSLKNIWISENRYETVMGADPEFLLFDPDNDAVVHANSIMSKDGDLGSDGAMAEIRPKPAKNTERLVENMRGIFGNKTLTENIRHLKWLASCYYRNSHRDFPVGGHIHIGNTQKILAMPEAHRQLLFAVLNKVLDEHLAIPMTRLDGAEPGSRRRTKCSMVLGGGNGYGYFGEWRIAQGRLEHRTLSGMWLMHPSLSKAVLGTARAIIDEVYSRISDKNYDINYICPNGECDTFRPKVYGQSRGNAWRDGFDGWSDIPLLKDMRSMRSSADMNKMLNTCNTASINKPFLNKWLNIMKSFSSFSYNEEEIRALKEILSVPIKSLTGYDRQIQPNWLTDKKFIVDL